MKRYLLFSGYSYYPKGGADDMVGDFDTVEEAQAQLLKMAVRRDWWQILDTQTGAIMYSQQ